MLYISSISYIPIEPREYKKFVHVKIYLATAATDVWSNSDACN